MRPCRVRGRETKTPRGSGPGRRFEGAHGCAPLARTGPRNENTPGGPGRGVVGARGCAPLLRTGPRNENAPARGAGGPGRRVVGAHGRAPLLRTGPRNENAPGGAGGPGRRVVGAHGCAPVPLTGPRNENAPGEWGGGRKTMVLNHMKPASLRKSVNISYASSALAIGVLSGQAFPWATQCRYSITWAVSVKVSIVTLDLNNGNTSTLNRVRSVVL